jgi:CheY-like chemotaxis protein
MTAELEILIVEDTPDVRMVLELAFKRPGYRATLVENGEEAVELCLRQGRRFDAVLMDLQMPVMDGITATRLLRAQPGTRDLVIICLSAHTNLLDADATLFDRLVSKPFLPTQLFQTIEEALAARRG